MLRTILTLCAAAVVATGPARGQLLRDDFRTGSEAPNGWALREGAGRWDPAVGGKRTISVTGTGDDVSYWAREIPQLKPRSTYALRFRAKASPGSSTHTLISGLDACNRDFGVGDAWQDFGFVFHTPDGMAQPFLRLGQWHLKGTVTFRNVSLHAVTPVHRSVNGLSLGAGEVVHQGAYTFTAPLVQYGSNHARCLVGHTAPFNSNRWVFTGGSEVVYRHSLGRTQQLGGAVTINVNYRTGGECVVHAANGDGPWSEIGRASELGTRTFQLPSALFPADDIRIRLEGASAHDAAGNSAPGAFQVDHYLYRASLRPDVPEMAGSTTYVEELKTTPGMRAQIQSIGDLGRGGDDEVRVRLEGDRAVAGEVVVSVRLTGEGKPAGRTEFSSVVRLVAGRPATATVPYTWASTGPIRCVVSVLRVRAGKSETLYSVQAEDFVPTYYASDYGHSLTPVPSGELWWCEAPYKVPPSRLPPPQEFGAGLADLKAVRGKGAISLSAARREREHAQLIFRPTEDSGPVRVTVSDLIAVAPGARARIPAQAIEVREVAYVRVSNPTDRVGVAGEWPDPLPPLEGPWRPKVGRNNPLWLTVTVPAQAKAGDYAGTVTLTGAGWKREIVLRLHVWNFALPASTSLRSGFGVQPGSIRRYHNLKTPGSLEQVWDRYMEAFRKRRIAPYNPMALAPYKIELVGRKWVGGTRDASGGATGTASLRVADTEVSADVNATYAEIVPIRPGARYSLSWKCKTEKPGQAYLLTVGHYDANRQWMTGRNNDMPQSGSGAWEARSVDITDRIPPDARYVNLTLRPALWTEKGENTGTAWFDDVQLRVAGEEAGLLVGGDFEADQPLRVSLDFTEFDKAAAKYLDGMGFNAFTVHIEGLPGGRHPNFAAGSFMGYAPGTPEYDSLMTQYGKLLEDHLEAKGWLPKAYVYWYDEPEVNDYPVVREGSARLKRYFPRIKRMMTEQFEEPLFGSVDLWCPITPAYDRDRAAARQRLGEEVWWYVCTGPKEPYCTLFIDHPAIELRMWLWQTWQRRIEGILIWETTWWTSPQQFTDDKVQNPWDDPMAYVGDVTGVWGNGDGRFYYPPNRDPNGDRTNEFLSGPVDALRWEMLGDGIEDWEYFRLLEQAAKRARADGREKALVDGAEALLRIPEAITADMTRFTTDPQPLLRHRAAIARAIERLGGR